MLDRNTDDDLDDAPAGELTPKQAEFCRQYLLDLNASAAGRRAGYAVGSTSGEIYRLMAKPEVAAEIDRLIAERSRRTGITADRVVIELAQLAFSNINDFEIDDSGNVKPAEGTDPLALRAVASVRRKARRLGKGDDKIEEFETEVKLWDKLGALKMLGQHCGLFDKKLTVAGDPDKPLTVKVDSPAALPADSVIVECLRRLGLPLLGDPPPAARG